MLAVWTLVAAAALADEPTHDIVPEDMFTLDAAWNVASNRYGTEVVFVRGRWDVEADERRTDLWMLDTRGRESTRLTFLDDGAWSPTWGPDDDWIYFLTSDADDHTQVFRIDPDGGDPQQITRAADGVAGFQVTDDHVWYATNDTEHGDDAWESLRDRFSDLHYVDRTYTRTTVHRLSLDSWRSEEIWAPGAYLLDFEVTDDGERVAGITAPDRDLITHEGWTEVKVLDVDDGAVTTVPDTLWRDDAPSPYGWMLGLKWSSDGRALAFRVDWDGYNGETYVAEFAGDEPLVWAIPRPREITPEGTSITWIPGTRDLCVQGSERARTRIFCVTRLRGGKSGRERSFPSGDVVVTDYTFSGDGRDVFAVVGTPEKFGEIYQLPARGNLFPRQLTDLNPHVADWKLPKVQLAKWTAPDGTEVEGILETPWGWSKEDGPLPLVVAIHGGPTANDTYRRRFRQYGRTSFAAKGWALFSPNYRGSTSYGDQFVLDLIGAEADIEVKDILAGVDKLVEIGVADPERMAVMGWSNGGFLTNAIITQTDRFKAASSGAGVFDQTIQWALEDTPGHVINFMEGLPWDKPEETRAASPLFKAHQITTPTLIHVGENDARVPPAHAKALFRALDVYLDVPTELVIYPNTGHGVRGVQQRKAKILWDHAWFEHWVLGEGDGEPVADDTAEEASETAAEAPSEDAAAE